MLLHLVEKVQPISPSFCHVDDMQSDGTSLEKSYPSSTLVNVVLLKGWALVVPAPSPEGLRKALAEAASYISKVRQILQYCLKFALSALAVEMSATSAGAIQCYQVTSQNVLGM